jgi:small subunit ribosomal protein S7
VVDGRVVRCRQPAARQTWEKANMPRRAKIARREVLPDAKYHSKTVTMFINKVMLDGKKSTAERIVYDALAIIGEKTGKDPIEQLEASLKALTPALEVRSRRVGGATYQVPVEVPPRRARTLAVRWLVEFARQRREKTMAQRLANELMDALNSQGGAYKRKDDIYRMAQANKAFAHYRW